MPSPLPRLNRSLNTFPSYPIKVLQIGEGNFLRAFVDWIIQQMNKQLSFEAGVAVVQPLPQGMVEELSKQEGLYTLILKGFQEGNALTYNEIITCIEACINPFTRPEDFLSQAHNPELEFIVSNTTEAGIAYEATDSYEAYLSGTFPAKMTRFMHERFLHFEGSADAGCIFLPCELINYNGDKLKECMLQYAQRWKLEQGFTDWLDQRNIFCNTLVDRIVPGYPGDRIQEIHAQLGFEDKLISEGELFHLWVIEGPKEVQERFPADKAGLNVLFTDDMQPYRTRKVRILNGAHTSTVPVAYLSGLESVRESVEHPEIGSFLQKVLFEEIITTLDLPPSELESFAKDVLDRFRNPFIHHRLISISLNSISKFKTRCLPSLLTYIDRKGGLPPFLSYSLACLMQFYNGKRGEEVIELRDNPEVIEFFKKHWRMVDSGELSLEEWVHTCLSHIPFWGADLSGIPGLTSQIVEYLELIEEHGALRGVQELVG